jgi:hypothetical protein
MTIKKLKSSEFQFFNSIRGTYRSVKEVWNFNTGFPQTECKIIGYLEGEKLNVLPSLTENAIMIEDEDGKKVWFHIEKFRFLELKTKFEESLFLSEKYLL